MAGAGVGLDEGDVDDDPFHQFGRWFAEAAAVLDAPEAMAVATADAAGLPCGADGAPQVVGGGGVHLLHQLRQPQGPGPGGEPPRRSPVPLGGAGHARCGSRDRSTGPGRAESDAYFASVPSGARSAPTPRTRAAPWPTGRPSTPRWRRRRRRSAAAPSRGRPGGVASGWSRRSSNSGSSVRAACTTACATCPTATPGGSSGLQP